MFQKILLNYALFKIIYSIQEAQNFSVVSYYWSILLYY